MKKLTFNEYQKRTATTAIYPEVGLGTPLAVSYCGLGAAGEAGEVANKINKMLRDDGCQMTDQRRTEIRQEIGGALWYLSQLCSEIKVTLEFVAQENLNILADRKARGVLKGSGDNR